MAMISYAQNQEDVRLRRAFRGHDRGFYVDAGAAHPVFDSVTKTFSLAGWRGVNIEPLPDLFALLCADRPHDVNLNVGLSSAAGTLAFYRVPACDGWSTFSPEVAAGLARGGAVIEEVRMPVRTLADVCAEHARGLIDFLKVDVEGHERAALTGGDWGRYRPRVVVVEATESNSPVPNHHLWEDVLLGAGYLFVAFDGVNRYYVRPEDRHLAEALALPVSVLDDFVPYRYQHQIDALRGEVDRRIGELLQFHADVAAKELHLALQQKQIGALERRLEPLLALEPVGPRLRGLALRLHRLALRLRWRGASRP